MGWQDVLDASSRSNAPSHKTHTQSSLQGVVARRHIALATRMVLSHRSHDENTPTSDRAGVRDDILFRSKLHATPRSKLFADPPSAPRASGTLGAAPEREFSTLERCERDHGRVGVGRDEIDHLTPVLAPGGALNRGSPWSERAAYARAHPYAIPPRRLGPFEDAAGVSGRSRALERSKTITDDGREARREACESAWRRASAVGTPRAAGSGAIVYRGYGGSTMGGAPSGLMDTDGERGYGGAATFKRFGAVNIFGHALKKYVSSVKKWDDAGSLERFKSMISSFENGTMVGRAHAEALEWERSRQRAASREPVESLSAKHSATIRDMQESLRLRRENLRQVLSSSTASALDEQLERLTVEAQEAKVKRLREKAARKFLKPLTATQLEAVKDALRAPSSKILAKASFVGQGALEATGKDIATLKKGTWLNDEVANFAIGMLSRRVMERRSEGETQPRAHFFSTFFINKLYQDSGRYEYSNVRRWTLPKRLKYDVLRCEKIYVPVHQAVHWVLAEIDIREKRISYYDSLLGESAVTVKNLKRWICDEAKNKLDEEWDPDEWEECYPKSIPLQKNGCDCGVFMIKYAEYLSSDAELAFSQKHMDYFRDRLVSDILDVGVDDDA